MGERIQKHNVKEVDSIVKYLYENYLEEKGISVKDNFILRVEGLLYGKMFRTDQECIKGVKDRYSNGEILLILNRGKARIQYELDKNPLISILPKDDYRVSDGELYESELLKIIVEYLYEVNNTYYYSFNNNEFIE